jgi:hypothetical protein
MCNLPEIFKVDKVRDIARNAPGLLSDLADESEYDARKRSSLQKDLSRLEKAYNICKTNASYTNEPRWSNRAFSSPYSSDNPGNAITTIDRVNVTTLNSGTSSSIAASASDSGSTSLTVPSPRDSSPRNGSLSGEGAARNPLLAVSVPTYPDVGF